MPGEGLTRGPLQNKKQTAVTTQIIRHSLRNGFYGLSRALPGDRAFLPLARKIIALRT
jgi:hypothetical protein